VVGRNLGRRGLVRNKRCRNRERFSTGLVLRQCRLIYRLTGRGRTGLPDINRLLNIARWCSGDCRRL
jgi:hypothetical protein